MTTPNELVPTAQPQAAPSGYALIESTETMREVLQLIDENLGSQRFSVLNLPRIKVPAGGAREFRVGGAGGDEPLRQISAVITAFRQARVYWKKAYGFGAGKNPPACTSTDVFIGVGDPGGDCATSPYAKYGTA